MGYFSSVFSGLCMKVVQFEVVHLLFEWRKDYVYCFKLEGCYQGISLPLLIVLLTSVFAGTVSVTVYSVFI